ncbi:ATP-binding cassette domain-containing protein, partial [Longicatena caecimuris]|uniref:ATP-binding cassette domain-containing protein n=1 Tax=Longicatena caecimuris TaxID=1796635 RepID=UPI003AB6AD6E
MIDVKNLRKSYQTQDKTVEILKGINIHVNLGDFMIIMGESGSGKTTFLNCVSGFDTIDEGSIEIGGTKL